MLDNDLSNGVNMTKKNMKDIDVPDVSEEFDDCLGKKETENKPGSLADFLGISDTPESEEDAWKEHNYQNWREHWKGMPEFESTNIEPKRSLTVHFRSQEDVDKFSELLDMKLSEKAKSTWYPPREKDQNSLRRWLDDGEA